MERLTLDQQKNRLEQHGYSREQIAMFERWKSLYPINDAPKQIENTIFLKWMHENRRDSDDKPTLVARTEFPTLPHLWDPSKIEKPSQALARR